ncbi:hypothetical protein [Rhodopila sp.]|uniref:hypothetical protein n=1 Tax=Rhodopila sp. TaxID=2480087 RepID=UPI003D0B76F4
MAFLFNASLSIDRKPYAGQPVPTYCGLPWLRDACHNWRMLDLGDVDRLADKVATATLKGVKLSRVYSTATTDSDGRDALNVTIVVDSKYKNTMTGDTALNAIVRIQRDLRASGEERFAIVDFTTEDELTSNGDT